jgi:hypothetical protein
MPVTVRKRGDKFRVIEVETGKIAKNKGGTALDGGGHKSKDKAGRQARAVNRSLSKRMKLE